MNEIKYIMLNLFAPSLRAVLCEADPEKFKKWGGNYCKQAAVFGVKFLEKTAPYFDWTAWDGKFEDKEGIYNHAWILGRNCGERYLVDVSRTTKQPIFISVPANRYPNEGDYKGMKRLSFEQLDVEKLMNQDNEYYTGKPGHEVLAMVVKRMVGEEGYAEWIK